jgi:hypothetical protein
MSNFIEVITGIDLTRLKSICDPGKIQNGTSVAMSGVFKVFHQDFDIGKTSSGKLHLTPRDIRQIRKLIKEQTGYDILTDLKPSSRTEMAKYFPNEKLSSTPVKDKVVKIYGLLSTNINGKVYDLEDGMNIEMPLSYLVTIEHNQIVIVENYEAFTKFRCIKSDMGPNPLVIYRGDKEGSVISKEMALNFPQAEIVAWFDTDPSGISLASATESSKMLVPDLSGEDLSRYGRTILFNDQYQLWERVSNIIPLKLKLLMSKTGKGITQEAIIANSIPLVLHHLK